MQSELNIGIVGHVDHGKTSLTHALTGKWTDTHSEEIKRGITIKLGYADFTIYECGKCEGPKKFSVKETCPNCNSKTREMRRISLLDAPGHETLMATVIAASSIIDGAIFVIAANEECPQPQTIEHLALIEASEIKNVIIVQNKVDLVTKEQAKKNYLQVREFLKGSSIENAPIIPTVANAGLNVDVLLQTIFEKIPIPKRNENADPYMFIARSFDINKPGTDISKLNGGAVGGSLIQGNLSKGDTIEILPGALLQKKDKQAYIPLKTKIIELHAGSQKSDKVMPGGLIGISTQLDPAITKADNLVGCVVGIAGKMPKVTSEITVTLNPIKRTIEKFPETVAKNEPLVLGIGTATTVGFVANMKKKKVTLTLKKPVCIIKNVKIAVMRRINNRWRLFGTAQLE